MDIEDLAVHLRDKVKPDLNLVYVEPPFYVESGLDFGWFCREHALHLYILARILGFRSEIEIGDITVSNSDFFLSTVGSGSDHAWCKVGDVTPVDISISLQHVPELNGVDIVFGCQAPFSKPYTVFHFDGRDARSLQESASSGPAITFVRHRSFCPDPRDLVLNPYTFLIPSPQGTRSFADTYGTEIFDMITLHCLRLVEGKESPWFPVLNAKTAIRAAQQDGRDARNLLLKRL